MLALAPVAKNKMARAALGLLIGSQHALFWLLAPSNGLHWWHGPQPTALDRELLILFIVLAALAALLYGFIAAVFWRWFDKEPPRQKLRAIKHKFTYAVLPLLFGLNAVWGWEALQKRDTAILVACIVGLWVIYVLGRHALFVFLEWPTERITAE